MLKIALFIVVVAQVASAQTTTWKGLRFGMKEADVRKEYPASFEKKLIEQGEFALLDRNQTLAGSKATEELYFDKSGKLEQIDLSLPDDPFAADSDTSAAGSSLAVVSMVSQKLVEKYGVAIAQEGRCEVPSMEKALLPSSKVKIFVCKSLWKADGQTINMYCTIRNQRLSSLALVYKPIESDI
jgi:hypothetical protein